MKRKVFEQRRGVETVELAVLLPFLFFLFLIGTDFARVMYYAVTVGNCARNGAVVASDPFGPMYIKYDGDIKAAAKADAGNIDPKPEVTVSETIVNGITYVDVTVTYDFKTLVKFPGIPNTTKITRTV